jgi:hypothetical protein
MDIPRTLPDDPQRAAQIYRLAVLHRHWLHADSIKERISLPLRGIERLKVPSDLRDFGELLSAFMALSVWYALLYVVIEGYKEMGLSDVDLDRLLVRADYVDLLRRFRNSILHYQEDALCDKHTAFLYAEGSEKWILDLNRAFEAFFLRELPIEEWLNKVQQPSDLSQTADGCSAAPAFRASGRMTSATRGRRGTTR